MQRDRLKKLAHSIDALAERDERLMHRAHEIAALRRKAAMELHATCAGLVASLNELLTRIRIEMDPPEFNPENLREDGLNLFQINVRGRVLQIGFQVTPELVSTEDFRVPYVMEGSIRTFNQALLEQDLIEEHSIFYCLEKERHFWRFFDERTYRTGPVDTHYLAALLEQLL